MWNLEDKSLFRSGALGEMRTAGIELADTVVDTAIGAFQPNENENVINEIVRFREFIKGVSFKLRHAELEKLTVSITMPAGEGSVTLALAADLRPIDDNGVIGMLNDAEIAASSVAMVKQLFGVLATVRQNASNIQPKPQQQQQTNGKSGSEEQTHTAQSVTIENYNGKKRFRIKAGWFMAYGAPVYEEVLKACGYENLLTMEPGEYPFVHPITVKVDENKKPKVVAIN